jgi:hypothetical protein
MNSPTMSDSDLVREHAARVYLAEAQRQSRTTFRINAGEVHKQLGFHNRVPLVCAALKSAKFLKKNHLRLVAQTGPPSGQSTTVTLTYEILGQSKSNSESADPLLRIRGIAKELFEMLGGGEAFIHNERRKFYDRSH